MVLFRGVGKVLTMAITLTNEILQDDIAVSLANAIASANKCARKLGVDALQSLSYMIKQKNV